MASTFPALGGHHPAVSRIADPPLAMGAVRGPGKIVAGLCRVTSAMRAGQVACGLSSSAALRGASNSSHSRSAVRPPLGLGSKTCADDQGQGVDQRRAALGAFGRRELGQQAADTGGDTDGVGGGEDGDAVIGGAHDGLDRLAVSRLANDHRGGTPPQAGTQPLGEGREMARDFRR